MRVGRNESCPCGSGKKYKACCEGKHSRGMSGGLLALFAAIAVIAVVGGVAAMRDDGPKPATRPGALPARTAQTLKPQPPGPAPAGKVWSAEHGHWHDAAPQSQPPVRVAPPPKPQPGPAPAGKVWSPEHGHWHDAKTP